MKVIDATGKPVSPQLIEKLCNADLVRVRDDEGDDEPTFWADRMAGIQVVPC